MKNINLKFKFSALGILGSIGILFGFSLLVFFSAPTPAFASCNINEQAYEPQLYNIPTPSGTYTDPTTLPITINGETAAFCQDRGGNNYLERYTNVMYDITNSANENLFDDSWTAPLNWSAPTAGGTRPFTINDSFDATNWPAGTYT